MRLLAVAGRLGRLARSFESPLCTHLPLSLSFSGFGQSVGILVRGSPPVSSLERNHVIPLFVVTRLSRSVSTADWPISSLEASASKFLPANLSCIDGYKSRIRINEIALIFFLLDVQMYFFIFIKSCSFLLSSILSFAAREICEHVLSYILDHLAFFIIS